LKSHKIKVLIVDDSALIRALLTEIISKDERLEVCGAAVDPFEARELIKKANPDVLTLDIEMPKMSGIDFLRNLMRLRPMPVVMISTLTQEGAPETLTALELGAVDFVPKPKNQDASALGEYAKDICSKIRAAARANVSRYSERGITPVPKTTLNLPSGHRHGYICAIGASTGGTEAIKSVVQTLPSNFPPVVVTQHIPEAFSKSFAARVDSVSELSVCEAEDGQEIKSGNVYIAPGHSHLLVKKRSGGLYCSLSKAAPVNRHRPSVDPMFDSVTDVCGANATGVILTGMGADGSEAMLRMRQAGATTIAQSESTCVVWGMPKVAFEIGATSRVLDLDQITQAIVNDYSRSK